MNNAKQEYASLREEILMWYRQRTLLSVSSITLSAGAIAFGLSQNDAGVRNLCLLIPHTLVFFTYMFIVRNSRLLTRMAAYLAVFHSLPDGGWELFCRSPEANKEDGPLARRQIFPRSLYTSYGFLLYCLLMSTVLLVYTAPLPWGLIAIALSLLDIAYYSCATNRSTGYHARNLRMWRDLHEKMKNTPPHELLDEIIQAADKVTGNIECWGRYGDRRINYGA